MTYDIFRTDRLVFIPIEDTPEHADFLLRMRSDPAFPNHASVLPLPGGTENSKEIVRFARNKRVALYICLPGNSADAAGTSAPEAPIAAPTAPSSTFLLPPKKPRVIGIVTLSKPGYGDEGSFHHAEGEIGLNVLGGHRGKGYGGAALRWMLWYAFVMAGLHRVSVVCYGWNKGARRLYERSGFTLEGVDRERLWFMGARHDLIHLGLLRREWVALQKEKGEDERMMTGEGLDSDAVARIMGCA